MVGEFSIYSGRSMIFTYFSQDFPMLPLSGQPHQVDHQASELQSLREKNEELSEAVDQYNLQQKVSRTAGRRFFSGRLWVADCFERVSDVLLVVGSISDGFFNGLIFVFGMSLVVVSHGFWWVFLAAGRSREWGQTYA